MRTTFLAEHPDPSPPRWTPSSPPLEGRKVLLTLFWPQAQFLLAFLRDHNTARSVSEVFDHLDDLLGRPAFERLFPLLLTDNGSEFSNPDALELHGRPAFSTGRSSALQPYPIERAHELSVPSCPRVLPFDSLSQRLPPAVFPCQQLPPPASKANPPLRFAFLSMVNTFSITLAHTNKCRRSEQHQSAWATALSCCDSPGEAALSPSLNRSGVSLCIKADAFPDCARACASLSWQVQNSTFQFGLVFPHPLGYRYFVFVADRRLPLQSAFRFSTNRRFEPYRGSPAQKDEHAAQRFVCVMPIHTPASPSPRPRPELDS